ncbi:MAG TPA: hypothetical protein VIG99_33340 [Myxococcaceae bacterium]
MYPSQALWSAPTDGCPVAGPPVIRACSRPVSQARYTAAGAAEILASNSNRSRAIRAPSRSRHAEVPGRQPQG